MEKGIVFVNDVKLTEMDVGGWLLSKFRKKNLPEGRLTKKTLIKNFYEKYSNLFFHSASRHSEKFSRKSSDNNKEITSGIFFMTKVSGI